MFFYNETDNSEVSAVQPVFDGSLVSYDFTNGLSFDGTGNILVDQSGNGNDGTILNTLEYQNNFGGEAIFQSDEIKIENLYGYDFQNGFSFSIWWYNPGGGYRGVFSNGTSNSRYGSIDLRAGSESGGTRFFIRTNYYSSSLRRVANLYADINSWNHLVFTYDNSFLKGYKNKVLETSVSVSAPIAPYSGATIGRLPGWSEYLNGKVAAIKIYDQAITQEDVNTLYDAHSTRLGV